MDAKTYLSQVRLKSEEVDRVLSRISQLRELMTGGSPVYSGMPGGGRKPHAMDDRMAKLLDLEREADRLVDELIDLKAEVILMLGRLSNAQHEQVLYQRYVLLKPWKQVAEAMGLQKRRVLSIAAEAINAADTLLKQ